MINAWACLNYWGHVLGLPPKVYAYGNNNNKKKKKKKCNVESIKDSLTPNHPEDQQLIVSENGISDDNVGMIN